MNGRELPARATPVTPAEVYLALKLQLETQLQHPVQRKAAVILVAQMALETGRFKSTMNWNFGGVKCTDGWQGCWQHFPTHEHWSPEEFKENSALCKGDAAITYVGPSKKPGKGEYLVTGHHPANKFRAFTSFDDAISHHVSFLLGRYRKAVDVALLGDPSGYVMAIHRLGYFTAPPETYAHGVELMTAEFMRSLPADPEPPREGPKDALVSVAASTSPPEAPKAVLAPATAPQPVLPPLAPPPVVVLPRVGEPLKKPEQPWYWRLLGFLFRLLARRPMP